MIKSNSDLLMFLSKEAKTYKFSVFWTFSTYIYTLLWGKIHVLQLQKELSTTAIVLSIKKSILTVIGDKHKCYFLQSQYK